MNLTSSEKKFVANTASDPLLLKEFIKLFAKNLSISEIKTKFDLLISYFHISLH